MESKTIETSPKVSVVMCVWNGEKYLRECIDSILNQSFQDFEFIIVNDGSTDGTAEILQTYAVQDPRVRILENPQNMGIGFSRNKGNGAARGEYIAVMDQDDWSDPSRFAKQVVFLDEHPEIAILGTAFWRNNGGKLEYELTQRSTVPGVLRWEFLFDCAMLHPTTMMRASLVKSEGFKYVEGVPPSEDFELFTRIVKTHQLTNLEEPLLFYRTHANNTTSVKRVAQMDYAHQVIRRQVLEYTGQDLPEKLVLAFRWPAKIRSVSEAKAIVTIYLKLLQQVQDWNLDREELGLIRGNFFGRLRRVAKSVHLWPPKCIPSEELSSFWRNYFQYLWYLLTDLPARGLRVVLRTLSTQPVPPTLLQQRNPATPLSESSVFD